MGYGVWGTGYGVQPSELRAKPEGTIFLRGALRARVIVRNSFGAYGGQSHLLGVWVWGMGYGVWGMAGVWEAPRTARGTVMAVLRWCRKPRVWGMTKCWPAGLLGVWGTQPRSTPCKVPTTAGEAQNEKHRDQESLIHYL